MERNVGRQEESERKEGINEENSEQRNKGSLEV